MFAFYGILVSQKQKFLEVTGLMSMVRGVEKLLDRKIMALNKMLASSLAMIMQIPRLPCNLRKKDQNGWSKVQLLLK